jgi:hypothetical protein
LGREAASLGKEFLTFRRNDFAFVFRIKLSKDKYFTPEDESTFLVP